MFERIAALLLVIAGIAIAATIAGERAAAPATAPGPPDASAASAADAPASPTPGDLTSAGSPAGVAPAPGPGALDLQAGPLHVTLDGAHSAAAPPTKHAKGHG